MSTATSGRAREHRVRDHLAAHGWEPIFRAAGSKGPADIGMAHEDHGLALIQVGTRNKALGPADRARLLRAAWLCSALPILAQVIPTPGKATEIRYWLVGAGTARTWELWQPSNPSDSTGRTEMPQTSPESPREWPEGPSRAGWCPDVKPGPQIGSEGVER